MAEFAMQQGTENGSTATTDIRPNHTIYINNLNEKIKKEGEFLCVIK